MDALVLFSGGKDSTVALAWACDRYREVLALSFETPFRPAGERRAAEAITRRLGVGLETVALPFLRDVAQVSSASVSERQTEGAYVPVRNLIYHGIACHLAVARRIPNLVAGHIKSDGNAYVDATASYVRDIYRLVDVGHDPYGAGKPPELQLPLAELSDLEVIALGVRLGAPQADSWSCLEDGTEPCGRCVSCRDRRAALAAAEDQTQS